MKSKLHFFSKLNFLSLFNSKKTLTLLAFCAFIFSVSGQNNGISFDCLIGGGVAGTVTFGTPDGIDNDGYAFWTNGSDGSTSGYTLMVEDDNGPTWSVRQPGSPGPRLFLSAATPGNSLPSCDTSDWQPDLFCDGVIVTCVPGGPECDVNVSLNVPADPVEFDTAVDLSASYSGFTAVSATWFFSSDGETFDYSKDGDITANTIEFNNTAPAISPGVYDVKLVVTDDCGDETEITSETYLVIYDMDGGFVTGGGWYNSPEGALVGTITTGTVNFGLFSKYKKNGNGEIKGNTNIQFSEGDFHFKSESYDNMSLVISGEKKATYKGVGTVNNSGSHKFLIVVMDGDANGGDGVDRIRVKIWADGSANMIIYDNEIGSAENADANTALGGGSIKIHKPNNKNQLLVIDSKPATELKLWPNPSKSHFNYHFITKNFESSIDLFISDLNGRILVSKTISPNDIQQIGESLKTGVYLLTIKQRDETHQMKLIKR